MKIVHLCQYYMVGQTYQENYLPAAMARLGHAVTVIAGVDNPDFYTGPARRVGETLTDKGVTIRYTKIHYKSLYTPVEGLYGLLEQEAPELIFVHGFILTRCFALKRYAARHPDAILGADTHETYVLAFNSCFSGSAKDKLRHFVYFRCVYQWWRKYVEKRYKTVFYVTPPRKKYAMEAFGFSEDKLESLWLGADLSTLPYDQKPALRAAVRARYNLPDEARILLLAGKLDKKKQPGELAEAFKRLNPPGWVLFFVGSMDEDARAAVDAALPDDERVFCTGLVSGEETLRYIASADIAAYPGAHSVLWEETVCLGIPAIFYSPEEGDAEYLSDDSALFVRRGDAGEISNCLKALTADPEKRIAMGRRARLLGERLLSYDSLAKKALEVLTE